MVGAIEVEGERNAQMRNVPSAEILKHIHDRISELKTATPVIEVDSILKSLGDQYPDADLKLEDIAQFVFTAASIHDVGLVLPAAAKS